MVYFPPIRYHLFEFHDFTYFPSSWRNYITDLLQAIWFTDFLFIQAPAKRASEILYETVQKIRKDKKIVHLVDLCSGAGGPNYEVIRYFKSKSDSWETIITLTDLYPNTEAFKNMHDNDNAIQYKETPVDALNVKLEGFRTLYNCMHHMTEKQAEEILKNAVGSSDGIAIFELSERSLFYILLAFLGLPLVNLLYPLFFCRLPMTFDRFLLTYCIPIIPLFSTLDGILSSLRTYSNEDYFSIAKKADPQQKFQWSFHRERIGVYPFSVFIGIPKLATSK